MLQAYYLTGCNITSGLFGKGKKTVFRLLMQNSEEYTDVQHLGCALELLDDYRRSYCKCIASLNKKYSLSMNSPCAAKAKLFKAKKNPSPDNSFSLQATCDINCSFGEML